MQSLVLLNVSTPHINWAHDGKLVKRAAIACQRCKCSPAVYLCIVHYLTIDGWLDSIMITNMHQNTGSAVNFTAWLH